MLNYSSLCFTVQERKGGPGVGCQWDFVWCQCWFTVKTQTRNEKIKWCQKTGKTSLAGPFFISVTTITVIVLSMFFISWTRSANFDGRYS